MPTEKLIYQGAESKIFLLQKLKISDSAQKSKRFLTRENPRKLLRFSGPQNSEPCEEFCCFVIKRRIKKGYRIPEIDEKLRKLRTRAEAKIMEKLAGKINIPKIIKVDENSREIFMQYIEGKKLSDFLDNLKDRNEIMEQVGEEVSKLHDSDIIHEDLTTSNMILKDEKVFFIDFGLGFTSKRIEDKAVDLHLLKQALEAKHFKIYEQAFDSFLKGYNSKDREKILKQLKKVEARGRYKG